MRKGKIIIKLLRDPSEHRYNTVGDYYFEKNNLVIAVTKQINPLHTKLVLIHEFVEQCLCEELGIRNTDIDKFDIEFENDPERVKKYIEPGNDPQCIYHNEHVLAEKVERMICDYLGVNFDEYNNNLL